MRRILTVVFVLLVFTLKLSAQCGINDCPTGFSFTFDPPQIQGESIQLNNINPQFFTCLLSDSFSIGAFGAGVDFYIFQLLPDGSRMNNCHVLNDYPNNVVCKDIVTYSAGDFCGFPFGSFDITIDASKGFIPCDGGIYEVVAATWVDSLGLGTTVDAYDPPRTVYDVWPNGSDIYYKDTLMGTVTFDLNGGITPGTPNTTAKLREWNTNQTNVFTTGCEDVELFVEAMSVIANCEPFVDITTGITSELSNELYFTINNGNPIDLLDGLNPEGGILSGPDTLLGGNCYAGIYTETDPLIVPITDYNLCDEDTLRVYLSTTDLFTNNTVTDEMMILINGSGCDPCAPPCNFSINASYDCNTEELCVNAPLNTAIAWGPALEFSGYEPSTDCVIASPGFSTNYFVDVVDIYGCSASDVINIGYNGNVVAGQDITIFDGESFPLQATLPGGYDFNWIPAVGLSNSSIANPVASPSTTTTYTVIATNANGCISQDQITITVYPTNALVFEVGNTIAVCDEFEPITVDANFFPFTSCVWTLPDGSQIADCHRVKSKHRK